MLTPRVMKQDQEGWIGQEEIPTFSEKTMSDVGFVRERGYFFPNMVAASGAFLEGDWDELFLGNSKRILDFSPLFSSFFPVPSHPLHCPFPLRPRRPPTFPFPAVEMPPPNNKPWPWLQGG